MLATQKKCRPTMLARFEHVQKCWPTFEVIVLENLFLSKSSLKICTLWTNVGLNKTEKSQKSVVIHPYHFFTRTGVL